VAGGTASDAGPALAPALGAALAPAPPGCMTSLARRERGTGGLPLSPPLAALGAREVKPEPYAVALELCRRRPETVGDTSLRTTGSANT
jgi:hypothetical protein